VNEPNYATELALLRAAVDRLESRVEQLDPALRAYVKGAMDSFNHDLVQTCNSVDHRFARLERMVVGERGDNGLTGTSLMMREQLAQTRRIVMGTAATVATAALGGLGTLVFHLLTKGPP